MINTNKIITPMSMYGLDYIYIYKNDEQEDMKRISACTTRISIAHVTTPKYNENINRAINQESLNLQDIVIDQLPLNKEFQKCEYLGVQICKIQRVDFLQYFPNLTKLDLTSNELVDISQIFNAHLLNILRIDNNQVRSIRGINKLKHLTTFTASSNKIDDINELSDLIKLQCIHLNINKIGKQQLKYLFNLIYLQDLKLAGNFLCTDLNKEDLIPINTRNIDIWNQQSQNFFVNEVDVNINSTCNDVHIRQCSQLKNLDLNPELQVLTVAYCPKLNINCLKQNTNIHNLTIAGCGLKSITQIEELTQIQQLYLTNNNIVDLNGIEKLKQLKIFDISKNNVFSIDGIEHASQLIQINFSKNQIENCNPLKLNTQLQTIDLTFNKIHEIIEPHYWKCLETLNAEHNQTSLAQIISLNQQLGNIGMTLSGQAIQSQNMLLHEKSKVIAKESPVVTITIQNEQKSKIVCDMRVQQIESLGKVTQQRVTALDVSKWDLSKISFIKSLPHIYNLNISSNNINSLKHLQDLTDLQILNASYNKIISIRPLQNCLQLQQLNLSNNQLSNANEVIFLQNFNNLQQLKLTGNPFCCAISSIFISSLSTYTAECMNITTSNSEYCELQQLKQKFESEIKFKQQHKTAISELKNTVGIKLSQRQNLYKDIQHIFQRVREVE